MHEVVATQASICDKPPTGSSFVSQIIIHHGPYFILGQRPLVLAVGDSKLKSSQLTLPADYDGESDNGSMLVIYPW